MVSPTFLDMKKHPELESLSHICDYLQFNNIYIIYIYSRVVAHRYYIECWYIVFKKYFYFSCGLNTRSFAIALLSPRSVYAPWENDFSRTPMRTRCSILYAEGTRVGCTLRVRTAPQPSCTVFIVSVR